MKNYFICKRIIFITSLGFFFFWWLENIVISNYNKCKLLTFTQQNRNSVGKNMVLKTRPASSSGSIENLPLVQFGKNTPKPMKIDEN